MKINKNTWHYRLWKASYTFKSDVPEETDLCRYCHRVFWQMLGVAALASMILLLVVVSLVGVGMLLYKGFWLNPGIAFPVTAGLALAITLVVLYQRWLKGSRKPVESSNLVGSWVAAKKERVCPLIEFSEDDNG